MKHRLSETVTRFDDRLIEWAATAGPTVLRVSVGIIFLWFGALKFFPGLSPAQELALRTIGALSFGTVPDAVIINGLALWECLIGLGFLTGRFMRATIALMAVQMVGTFLPLVFFSSETFMRFPYSPTLEGQYIIKNIVLISTAIVTGAGLTPLRKK